MEKDISVETLTDKGEYSVEEEVKISVTVTNRGINPVELIFMSAQRYDFIVLQEDREVWRWSSDRVFAMFLGRLFLKSGEKQIYMETWKPKGIMLGEYKVVGTVTSWPAHAATCIFKIST